MAPEEPATGPSATSARRRPRIHDVAAKVGLSTATVSLALGSRPGPSASTRQRVQAAAAEIGYRPNRAARALARRRSRLLGVLMDVHNTFHADLVDHLLVAGDRHGYDLVLSTVTSGRAERRAIETLLDDRCDALLLLGSVAGAATLDALDDQAPVVVVGTRVLHTRADVVRCADDRGIALAVDHLTGLGHARITFVDGGHGPIAALRRRGYRAAMRRRGLANQISIVTGADSEDAGATAGRWILHGDLPTAVVAHNDRCAVGVHDALTQVGISIPGDISLVGFDDSPLARLSTLSLTSVNQNAVNMAEHAVQAAVERLERHGAGGREMVLEPYLTVRRTSSHPTTATSRRALRDPDRRRGRTVQV